MQVIEEFSRRYETSASLNIDDISIDGLLFESGLFDTSGIRGIFTVMTRRILRRDDISLQQSYEHTGINLSVKVFNITDRVYEFISHITDPELSVISLAQMTTAIPVLFKPILYRGKEYCDGGIRHGLGQKREHFN